MQKQIIFTMITLLFIPFAFSMTFYGDEPACQNSPGNTSRCVIEEGQIVNNMFELLDFNGDGLNPGGNVLMRVEGYSTPYENVYLGNGDYIVYSNSDGLKMKLSILGMGFSNNSKKAVMIYFQPVKSGEELLGDGGYCLDTDGQDKQILGEVTYPINGTATTVKDYCVDRHSVFEYSCSGSKSYDCGDLSICKNGACVFHISFFQRIWFGLVSIYYVIFGY